MPKKSSKQVCTKISKNTTKCIPISPKKTTQSLPNQRITEPIDHVLRKRESIIAYYTDNRESSASSKNAIKFSWLFLTLLGIIILLTGLGYISLLTYTILCIVIMIIFETAGFIHQSEESKYKKCDIRFFDIWSIGHLLLHVMFMGIIYLLIPDLLISFIISTLISLIWELIEYEAFLRVEKKNFFCETPINRFGDILFGIIGSMITYAVIYYFF